MLAPGLALIETYDWTIDNEILIGPKKVGSNDNQVSLVEIGEAISRIGDSQRSAKPNIREVEKTFRCSTYR